MRRRLGMARTPPVVPITLFRPGSVLHRALVAYKSGPDELARAAAGTALAELVAWFLAHHGRCLATLAGGGWDALDVVPSTRPDRTRHPLALALDGLPHLGGRLCGLLSRGAAPLDHLRPEAAAYRAAASPARRRVLLLDDVFTSGSHALSAAAALEAAGQEVVAVVPIGRLVHAEDPSTRQWWVACAGERETHPAAAMLAGVVPCCVEAPPARCPAAGRSGASQPPAESFAAKKSSTCWSAARVALPSTSRRSSVSTEWAALR